MHCFQVFIVGSFDGCIQLRHAPDCYAVHIRDERSRNISSIFIGNTCTNRQISQIQISARKQRKCRGKQEESNASFAVKSKNLCKN